ncbi:MAG TPA: ABC transporter substrate-binding protein [Bacillota bacterium]|nr:ABC transporter substrate-binding protein [Bacillota bacterium]
MTKKVVSAFLGAALIGTLFTGSILGAPKVSGKITFSSHRTDFATTVLPAIVKNFNKIYPNVKVEIETIKDYQPAMKIKMASDDLPDVWSVHNDYYSKEQLQQFNLPLNSFSFTKDFLGTDGFKGADGKIYALPLGMNTTGVVYNKKIFAKLGLKVPQTLDEFVAAGKKISAAGYVGLATAAKAGWPLQYFWQDIPKFISGDSDVRNKLAKVDEPFTPSNAVYKSYAILKRFADEKIIEKDPLSADWEPMKQEFRAGKVGMFLLGNWFVPQALGSALKMEDVGFFPFPYDNKPGPKNVILGPDLGLAIAKNSKNLPAAKAFFTFMMTTNYADYAKTCGLLSANKKRPVDLPYVKEFNACKPVILPSIGDTQAQADIRNKAQFDYNSFGQEILGGKDLKAAFTELNAKWKKAKQSL